MLIHCATSEVQDPLDFTPLSYFVFHFVFIFITLRGGLKKISLIYVTECSAYVFLQEFIVSGLTFRSLIHFEFIYLFLIKNFLLW